jgi:C_GCAxxG_C_C family probable redox protein
MNENVLAVPREEMKEKVIALAKANFKQGPNCAESVLMALIEAGLVDLPAEAVAMATPFGGGIGLSGGVCGALAAAVMGVGAVHGRSQPIQGEMKDIIDKLYGNPGLYRFFNQMPHEFAEKFGSTQCAVLNKDYPNDWYNKDRIRNCMKLVQEAAGMAVDYIYQGLEEGYGQPFGENMAGKV